MSQLYAEIQGSRGLASRQGTKKSGIWAHVRGWHVGVEINGFYNDEEDCDVFEVSVTSGSAGYGRAQQYIGKVKLDSEGQPTFILSAD